MPSVDTEIKNVISAAGAEAQYDEKAKCLLSNKIILAHILVKTVDEFRGMNPKDVSAMCNLSQGILEKGEARGEAKGEARIIINMHRNGFTMEQIVLATNKKVEEIEAIIEENESVWCNYNE